MVGTSSASFSSFPLSTFPQTPSGHPPQRTSCCSSLPQTPSNSPIPISSSSALAAIHSSGVIACLRAQSGDLAMEAAQAALDGGISVLEITMTTPDVFEVLQQLVQRYPSSILGVGTVLNSADAESAIKAGAKFIMSPATVKGILDDMQGSEVLYIPGVMTPTEVVAAYNAGARIVKTR